MAASPADLIPIELADGTHFQVEVRSTDSEEDVAFGRQTLDGVVQTIKGLGRELGAAAIAVKPDKATLKFGLELGIDNGTLTGVLVKGSASASVEVTMEWSAAP